MKIKTRHDENGKCPCCNWESHQLFGFDCNPKKEMLCGQCFCEMLEECGYEVTR